MVQKFRNHFISSLFLNKMEYHLLQLYIRTHLKETMAPSFQKSHHKKLVDILIQVPQRRAIMAHDFLSLPNRSKPREFKQFSGEGGGGGATHIPA